jgi:hypothetical protein
MQAAALGNKLQGTRDRDSGFGLAPLSYNIKEVMLYKRGQGGSWHGRRGFERFAGGIGVSWR